MINKETYKRLTKRLENGKAVVDFAASHAGHIKTVDRLAELEDKIENGTLVELPCKAGTTIYHLYKAENVITEDKIFGYHFYISIKPCVSFENFFWYGTNKRVDTIPVEHFGKYWFTDKIEAEAKLKELQEKQK